MNLPKAHYVFAWDNCRSMKSEIAHYLKGCKRVLDVGCADGKVMRELERAYPGREVVGVDIRKCKCVKGLQAHRVVGTVDRLPVPNGYFDGVVGSFILEYLDDKSSAVKAMLRALKPNGKGVFFLHHPENGIAEEMEQRIFENPNNTDARYYADRLRNHTFKSQEECENFFGKIADIEYVGVWEASKTKRNMCFEILLSNIEA